ncbi:hypothetical protein HK405_002453, partial [Cladochytrium tenue]
MPPPSDLAPAEIRPALTRLLRAGPAGSSVPPPFALRAARAATWDLPLSSMQADDGLAAVVAAPPSMCTRFVVAAAVCGTADAFTCEVLYDLADLRAPPDVLLPPPLRGLRLHAVSPLLAWNPADDANLLKLMEFLRSEFV